MNDYNQHLLRQFTHPVPQSGDTPNLVKTSTESWQIICWDLAKANRQFHLHGYKKQHKTFVEELAFTYGYHLETVGRNIVFCPNLASNQNRLQMPRPTSAKNNPRQKPGCVPAIFPGSNLSSLCCIPQSQPNRNYE